MRIVSKLFIVVLLICCGHYGLGQINRINYNNQNLFLSGANFAWVNFANDIGPGQTDFIQFGDIMLAMHDNGGNAVRWWLHLNGTNTPEWDVNDIGLVLGPGAGTIEDIRKVLDDAWKKEIGVNLCLWSFDMLRNGANAIPPLALARNRKLLTDTNYTRSYINNCLIPMIDSLKGHPAIIGWEIFNEPEGMSTVSGFGFNGVVNPDIRIPITAIQTFVNLCAGAIHRTDTAALVTNGSSTIKALSEAPAASPRKGSSELSQFSPALHQKAADQYNRKYNVSLPVEEVMSYYQALDSVESTNYYSDSRLIAAGGDSLGTLDFYSVHYYVGGGSTYSPFGKSASTWGLTKPLVVAEFAMDTTFGVPKEYLFSTLYSGGYAGALPWSWTDEPTQAAPNPHDMLVAMKFMYDNYKSAVDINGISGDYPVVTLVSPKADTSFADSADITLIADASDADGSIALVEFFANDTVKIGEADTLPYSVVWEKVANGMYTLSAIATDDSGLQRVSNKVPIKVGKPKMKRLEAEATMRSGPGMSTGSSGAPSNGAYVDIATNDTSAKITWQFNNLLDSGNYQIAFGYRLTYASPKSQFINVNGVRVAELEFTAPSTASWYEKVVNVDLVSGANTIQMQMSWGWMYLDYLAVPIDVVTSVEEQRYGLPLRFALQQNYPNPFNPNTTIKYQLPQAVTVVLKVYNILGQEVKTLVNEEQTAGPKSVILNAGHLASGIYFYRLQVGNFVDVKKMLLLK